MQYLIESVSRLGVTIVLENRYFSSLGHAQQTHYKLTITAVYVP